MRDQGAADEVPEAGTEHSTEVLQGYSGGCVAIDEFSWRQKLGDDLAEDEFKEKVEQLRHRLLKSRDIKKVNKALQDGGIVVNDRLITLVKRYNFDSPGISFTPDNYEAWTRLAGGNATIDDARYFVHEMAEIQELQQSHFNFMGASWDNMTRRQKRQWKSDFERYYMQAHSKALEAEYDFITQQLYAVVNDNINVSRIVAAAVDPNRKEARLYMLVDGVPLEKHQNFMSWQQKGNQIVELNQRTLTKLRLYQNPTLSELVGAVKRLKLRSD